jgi:methionyl-tRNA formyltransferase
MVVTHEDNPGRDHLVRQRRRTRRAPRHPGDHARGPERSRDRGHPRRAAQPDFLFSFYYRQMLKAPLLALPKRGGLEHARLAAAQVPRAGAGELGHHPRRARNRRNAARMVEKPDAGGILAQQAVPILPDDTAFDVFQQGHAGGGNRARPRPARTAGRTRPARRRTSRRAAISAGARPRTAASTGRRPAREVHNLIRAVAPPYPGAFSRRFKGRLRVLRSLHPSGRNRPAGGVRPCSRAMAAVCRMRRRPAFAPARGRIARVPRSRPRPGATSSTHSRHPLPLS